MHTLDVATLRALLASGAERPWVTLATVQAVSVEQNGATNGEAVWVDVLVEATGDLARARLATPYAGPGFGLFILPRVGQEAVVVFPSPAIPAVEATGAIGVQADLNGGIIIGLLPTDLAPVPTGADAPDVNTLLLVLADNQKLVVKKAGGLELLRCDSSTGQVTLGDVGHSPQGVGLGDNIASHLSALKTYLDNLQVIAPMGPCNKLPPSPTPPNVSSSIAQVQPS